MGMYGDKPAKSGVIDGHAWREFLKACHPTKTAQSVAARTGISADTVEKWFRGASPSFDAAFALFDAYGPEFLAAACPALGWLKPALREREIEALRDAQAALQARLDALS